MCVDAIAKQQNIFYNSIGVYWRPSTLIRLPIVYCTQFRYLPFYFNETLFGLCLTRSQLRLQFRNKQNNRIIRIDQGVADNKKAI